MYGQVHCMPSLSGDSQSHDRTLAGRRETPSAVGRDKMPRRQASRRGGETVPTFIMTMQFFALLFLTVPNAQVKPNEMPWIAVSKNKKGFVLDPSGRPFVPWGFN